MFLEAQTETAPVKENVPESLPENKPAPIEMAKKTSSHPAKPAPEAAENEKKPAAKPEKEEKPAPAKQEANATAAPQQTEPAPNTCTKTCTDQCLAKDGTTVQGLIVCLKNCKCEQTVAESLLKSKYSYGRI